MITKAQYQLNWKVRNPEKINQYLKTYRIKHKEKINLKQRLKKVELKRRVVEFYSEGTMKCKDCGYDNMISLDIDHIEEGSKPTKHSFRLFLDLIRENFPKGYQVLCRNCNYIKHYNYKNRAK